VVIQAMMTAERLRWPHAEDFIRSVISTNQSTGIAEIGRQIMDQAYGISVSYTPAERRVMERGASIYNELCFACHGTKGEGTPLQGGRPGATIAPPLAGSPVVNGVRDAMIDVVLKGLNGPVDGKNYTALMVPMESNNDAWLAAVISYVRNSFGNSQPFVSTNDVARLRATNKLRQGPWTLAELDSTVPQYLAKRQEWKVSASDNSGSAALAIDGKLNTRFDTARAQAPGMWYQIELPKPVAVSGLLLDAGESINDYPRGYQVEISGDGVTWGQPVATGKGDGPITEIRFPPSKGRFIKIVQTGSTDGLWWSIHELNILTPGAPMQNKTVSAPAVNQYE
jgi:mono/diheme cytochrome c family protein